MNREEQYGIDLAVIGISDSGDPRYRRETTAEIRARMDLYHSEEYCYNPDRLEPSGLELMED